MNITRTTKKEVGKYASEARELREKTGLSQQEVADKLDISRASYGAFEKGTRELSIKEVKKLAKVLGVTAGTFLGEDLQDVEKYKQMLLEFLRNNLSEDGKVTKTKMAKLLYLTDFGWCHENLESMSGMQYRNITYGPVPDAYFRTVDELYDQKKLNMRQTEEGAIPLSQTRKGAKEVTDKLSAKEKRFIAKIAKKWKNKNTQDIVNFTHNQIPYRFSREGEIIPYALIHQEDPGYAY